MVTVIQVFGSLGAGGAESRMMDVYRMIDHNHVQFTFICLNQAENQFYESEIQHLGGKIYKMPSPHDIGIIQHIYDLYKLFKYLKSENAIAVHAHTLYHCGIIMLAAKIAQIPIRISHARSTASLNSNSFIQKVFIHIGKTFIHLFATHRLALNTETAEFLYGKKAIKKGKIKILPNAIDLKCFEKNIEPTPPLDIPHNSIIIGHVGRFNAMKNHHFLIEFYDLFHQKYPNAHLVLVGGGPLKEEISQLVVNKRLDKQVHFLGLRKDVSALMSKFDIFILPSIFEGLVGSVLEAQAAGTPCLVSDSVSTSVDMGLGIVKFKNLNDPLEKWVETASKLLNNKIRCRKRITEAFKNKRFTIEQEIEDLYNIYNI